MSLVIKCKASPDREVAECTVQWDEPGQAGAHINFDVRVRTFPALAAQEIEQNAIDEAVRAAKAFIKFRDLPRGPR